MSDHSTLTGLNLHQPWHYAQASDPGAVGAGLTWFDTDGYIIYYRNSTNTAWVQIVASSWQAPELEILVPAGSDWSDFQTIFAAAPAGSTIVLANETILQTAALVIDKSMKIIGHVGGASKILLQSNVSYSGSALQMLVGWGTSPVDVKISGFEFEHDRTAMGSPGRTCCIVIGKDIASCEIDHLTFTDITSDCCHIWDYPDTSYPANLSVFNISFHDNVVNEWYESIFLTLSGSCDGLYIYNNTGTTSARHPQGGVSDPYGVDIGLEDSAGVISNCVIVNNDFTCTVVVGNSLGIVLSQDSSTGYTSYGPLSIIGNSVTGFAYNISIRWINANPATAHTVVVQNNTIVDGAFFIQVYAGGGGAAPNLGNAEDALILINNNTAPSYSVTGTADNLYILDLNNS